MTTHSPAGSTFASLDDHLSALYRLRRFGIKLGLETISRIMKGMGNPHLAYPVVHVAGTNGKGSVAACLSAILAEGGCRVGLYTSPHLIRFNERIQINGEAIHDEDLIQAAEAVRRVYTQGDPPTFFECATAMAFHYFAQKRVDWAVVETGLGGRYDATNVVSPEACVITNIGLEHTALLGKRIAQIAFEKAGIIKPRVGVVTGARQKQALEVIERVGREQGATVRRLGKEIRIRKKGEGFFNYDGPQRAWHGLSVGLPGDHQRMNAGLALGALEWLMEKGLKIPDRAVSEGLSNVRWPGRLEVFSRSPLVFLDGAHNLAAVRTLTRYLKKSRDWKRLTIVVGVLEDKAWKPMVTELAAVADRLILTRPTSERALDPRKLATALGPPAADATVVPNLREALSVAFRGAREGDAVCITGSLYTVGEAKAVLTDAGTPDYGE